jgi:hypothetical protein
MDIPVVSTAMSTSSLESTNESSALLPRRQPLLHAASRFRLGDGLGHLGASLPPSILRAQTFHYSNIEFYSWKEKTQCDPGEKTVSNPGDQRHDSVT